MEIKKLNNISKKLCESEIFLGWCDEEESLVQLKIIEIKLI
jgi:hypothetical protein